jgi:BioD-like phosphotransacetylase family protein
MPLLQIVSTRPRAGKSTVAVALARGLHKAGLRVSLVRAGDGDAAGPDAANFAAIDLAGAANAAPDGDGPADEIVIVEGDAGAELLSAAAIVVVRTEVGEADSRLAASLGDRLLGTIATAVVPDRVESVARDLTNGGLRPLALMTEDRGLAAPSVGEIGAALGAELLYAGDNESATVEDIVIAPVFADPAQPHFGRFAAKAVLAPFNKTDLHLAAIETAATCLVITGGQRPSPYVLDRAQGEATTVLLAPNETPATLAALAGVWSVSRFRGEVKAQRALAQLEGRIDFAALAKRLAD